MFFRRKAREEIEQLRRQNEDDERRRDDALHDLQLSRLKLASLLGVPVDKGLAAIGEDLAGKRKE